MSILLVVIACLPLSDDCRSIVESPAPVTEAECNRRAEELQRVLSGTIDDAGYVPRQVTCYYDFKERADK
jgi:hypothetical protein